MTKKDIFSFGNNEYDQLGSINKNMYITDTNLFKKLEINKFECGYEHTICFSKSKNYLFKI